jgi:hypothetical protein
MILSRFSAVALAMTSLYAAPAVAQRHVVFAQRDWHDADASGAVHIYIDGWGSLYPGRALQLQDSKLQTHGTLEQYFRRNPADWQLLATATGANAGTGVDRAWPQVQDTLRARLVRRIDRLAQQGGRPRTVVFLVHGFRVPDAEPGFELMGQRIRAQFRDMPMLLVHVHWDGMFSPVLSTRIGDTWEGANYNAPLVGLQLRRIFEGLKDDLPIRVITHSLGGGVIAAALWPRADIRRAGGHYAGFSDRSKGAPPFGFPPNPDIRLGMIVPAMRGEAFGIVPRDRRSAGNYPLVVVGQNRFDPVVAGNNAILGQTALAVAVPAYCDFVYRPYADDQAATAVRYDFSRPGPGTVSHDIKDYFRTSRIRGFLNLLFAPTPPPAENPMECRLKGSITK